MENNYMNYFYIVMGLAAVGSVAVQMFGGDGSSETEEDVARRIGPLREHRSNTLPPSQGGSRRKRNRSRRK
jgi:hypothetical protein